MAALSAWDDPLDALPAGARIGAVSAGVMAIPHLTALLGHTVLDARRRADVDVLVAWGDNRPWRRAAAVAKARGLSLIRLEDPFFRSVGLGKDGAQPVGVIADGRGLYFDASKPSHLETILVSRGWQSDALLERACDGRRRVVAERLSKYNVGVDRSPTFNGPRRIALIDQVAGDRSIAGAGADHSTFMRMAQTALAEHGAGPLVLRRHPDVVRGHACGFLDTFARDAGIEMVDDDITVDALLDAVGEVWTVSSQVGFDALIRDRRVVSFGMPFYAGYGLTADRATGKVAENARRRRGNALSIDELFAASVILATRYADPVTGKRATFEQALDRLVDWRARDALNRGWKTYAYGFSRWKRRTAQAFFGGSDNRVEFRRRFVAPPAAANSRVCVWGVRDPKGFEARCRALGHLFGRVEDGFVRSVGLGSDLIAAGSLVLDTVGIYYDAGRASQLEELLAQSDFSVAEKQRAAALRRNIVERGLSKYNLGGAAVDIQTAAGGRRVVLVAGQVPDDASTRLGAGDLTTMGDLVEAVRQNKPDAFLVYKEHPDIVSGNRPGHGQAEMIARHADLVLTGGDITALIATSDEIHVLSSLTGFEALLRERPVVCWGKPFYAGWGLTSDMSPIPRRTRKLELDALVAGALIAYPRYVSALCGIPCGPEDFIESLRNSSQRGIAGKPSILQRYSTLLGWT